MPVIRPAGSDQQKDRHDLAQDAQRNHPDRGLGDRAHGGNQGPARREGHDDEEASGDPAADQRAEGGRAGLAEPGGEGEEGGETEGGQHRQRSSAQMRDIRAVEEISREGRSPDDEHRRPAAGG
jgi:hypothetical protein